MTILWVNNLRYLKFPGLVCCIWTLLNHLISKIALKVGWFLELVSSNLCINSKPECTGLIYIRKIFKWLHQNYLMLANITDVWSLNQNRIDTSVQSYPVKIGCVYHARASRINLIRNKVSRKNVSIQSNRTNIIITWKNSERIKPNFQSCRALNVSLILN